LRERKELRVNNLHTNARRKAGFVGALLAAPLALALAIALASLLCCANVQAQTPTAKSKDATAGSAQEGKRIFTNAGCVACHGAEGQGTSLAPQIAPPPLELPGLIAYVRQPTGKMPPIPASTASDRDLANVYAFLKSVAPAATSAESLKGNAENGKRLFTAYGCYECHGHQGAGAAIAPRIGPPPISFAALLRYVRAPTGQMPPYTAKVASDQDFADIYAFLKTFPPPAPASSIPLLNE
jgi:mono/diheme cytochrome c family protein